MKLAFIPPFELISKTFDTEYQLFLPQCLTDPAYAARYHRRTTVRAEYTILDNGAAEGEQWEPIALMRAAAEWQPDEIVIPDVMGDAELTIKMGQAFLNQYWDWEYKFMFVVQGQTVDEVLWCMEQVDDDARIHTIGIPRHLGKTIGARDARLQIVAELFNRYGNRYEYHFLGAQPNWPQELQFAAVAYGDIIRGMDTSMPFNYAFYGEKVDGGMHMPRPKDYFNLKLEDFNWELVDYNCNKMLEWSRGTD